MGGVILFVILVLLVAVLVMPAFRPQSGRTPPSGTKREGDPPHEVVVHQLDDHRKKTTPDDAQKPQG